MTPPMAGLLSIRSPKNSSRSMPLMPHVSPLIRDLHPQSSDLYFTHTNNRSFTWTRTKEAIFNLALITCVMDCVASVTGKQAGKENKF
jgi:hypothetical protein